MFELDLPLKLVKLSTEIPNKKYKLGKYIKFKVYDPKERQIEALPYSDRVMLMCFCEFSMKPRIDKRLIFDNGASRENKGTDFSIKRLHKFLNDQYLKLGHNNFYFLKCDIRKYFDNINHEILLAKLAKAGFCRDELWLCEKIIKNDDYENKAKGLPLGNQTSQWFALLYLDEIDRLVKEKLRIKHYTRYMDDFVLIHENKQVLRATLATIRKVCFENLKLTLAENKTVIGRVSCGIDYLGFNHKVLPNGKVEVKQRQQAKIRMKRKIKVIEKLYKKKIIDGEFVIIRKNAYLNHLRKSKGKNWVRKRMEKILKVKLSNATVNATVKLLEGIDNPLNL